MNPSYGPLLTDLYQLTMACGYWRFGMADWEATFHLTFRRAPFGGQFAVACGAASLVDYLQSWRFSTDDLRYLGTLTGNDGRPLFPREFLDYLAGTYLRCDVDAMPEGTVAFAHQPLVRVRGPLLQAQLLETPLLNAVNFQTLVATKAARICAAAQGDPVIEFGLRRAQGPDGGMSASRAAYIGGCVATSNVLAGRWYEIPVKGTHAHSWVTCFPDEPEAFRRYAEAFPNNTLLLVDTYDTIQGVKNAITVARRLREDGHRFVGVRLDSGNLLELSRVTRRLLDEAGFEDAVIVASNDLNEQSIAELKRDGARIGVWGVGTQLATAFDQPALGGVYKLAAIRRPDEAWQYRLKLSEEPIKISDPGILHVARCTCGERAVADLIYHDERSPAKVPYPAGQPWVGIENATGERREFTGDAWEPLLQPLYRRGQLVGELPSATAARARAAAQLDRLDPEVCRREKPRPHPVVLHPELYQMKQQLIRAARGASM